MTTKSSIHILEPLPPAKQQQQEQSASPLPIFRSHQQRVSDSLSNNHSPTNSRSAAAVGGGGGGGGGGGVGDAGSSSIVSNLHVTTTTSDGEENNSSTNCNNSRMRKRQKYRVQTREEKIAKARETMKRWEAKLDQCQEHVKSRRVGREQQLREFQEREDRNFEHYQRELETKMEKAREVRKKHVERFLTRTQQHSAEANETMRTLKEQLERKQQQDQKSAAAKNNNNDAEGVHDEDPYDSDDNLNNNSNNNNMSSGRSRSSSTATAHVVSKVVAASARAPRPPLKISDLIRASANSKQQEASDENTDIDEENRQNLTARSSKKIETTSWKRSTPTTQNKNSNQKFLTPLPSILPSEQLHESGIRLSQHRVRDRLVKDELQLIYDDELERHDHRRAEKMEEHYQRLMFKKQLYEQTQNDIRVKEEIKKEESDQKHRELMEHNEKAFKRAQDFLERRKNPLRARALDRYLQRRLDQLHSTAAAAAATANNNNNNNSANINNNASTSQQQQQQQQPPHELAHTSLNKANAQNNNYNNNGIASKPPRPPARNVSSTKKANGTKKQPPRNAVASRESRTTYASSSTYDV